MEKEYLDINAAILYLKEGLVVIDNFQSRYKLVNDRVIIKSDNSRFNLEIKEFMSLYKNSKFLLLEETEQVIDLKKDEEYYSFKHK